MHQRSTAGFTLIEVMITVALLGIIAAIALPSYTSYLQRGRVPAALDALNTFYIRMEQNYQDTGSYANGGDCAVALPNAPHFTIQCALVGADGQGFTADATGIDNMEDYRYTIDHTGARSTAAHPKGIPATNCWSTRGSVCDS
jgi:type IV pilus assembly protein PilE